MYITKSITDFDDIKSKINPHYIIFVDFLESLKVGEQINNENNLFFQFGNLLQHWKLEVSNGCNYFSIFCDKKSKEVSIECLLTNISEKDHNLINYLDCFEYYESKYNIKFEEETSIVTNYNNAIYYRFYFEEFPVIEQVAQIYQSIFKKEG